MKYVKDGKFHRGLDAWAKTTKDKIHVAGGFVYFKEQVFMS